MTAKPETDPNPHYLLNPRWFCSQIGIRNRIRAVKTLIRICTGKSSDPKHWKEPTESAIPEMKKNFTI